MDALSREERTAEVEGGAGVLGLGADAAAVAIDDALRDRQPDARARKLREGVKPLERVEEPPGGRRLEACAAVAHEEDARAIRRYRDERLGGLIEQVHGEQIAHTGPSPDRLRRRSRQRL
ncbi:MAG TPA: hypothetical protein VNO33_20450 [Kofleriaceae bacterium]|nr:hypothetical protein [Kofleriaceae bacterium]